MNPAVIVSKAALDAIKALAQVIPQVVARLGPEAFARAALMREIAKVAPWVITTLGSGLTWLIVKASLKDHVRVAGRHGNTEIALEASSSIKKKARRSKRQRPVKQINLETTPLTIKSGSKRKPKALPASKK
jgi:hypothetical protein